MIKELDWQFLKDTAEALDVSYPGEGIDSFDDIYKAMITEALDILGITNEHARGLILLNIYFNYSNTRVDMSLEIFLEEHPEYLEHKDELENILY